MIGQALVQFLTMVQQLLSDYVSRAEANGRQTAEIERCKQLYAEFSRIVASLLQGSAHKLPEQVAAALKRAFDIAEQIVEQPLGLVQTQLRDHLYDMAQRPEYAAVAGSMLYEAATALRDTSVKQLVWSQERFRRPFVSRLLHRPYRHVGPADVDIQLVELLTVVHTTSRAAEIALRRLDLTNHPATLLLVGQSASTMSIAPPPSVGGAATARIQLSASPAVMERLRGALVGNAAFLADQSSVALNELAKATRPGGGVNAHTVRANCMKLLHGCAIGMARSERTRDIIATLRDGTVDAA